ncbi:hypothetical protein GCM10023231_38080 [Olivibacter ginsenosidimutans]|uniref:Uncharacterized protein n=1 Tax=Olivibacter ginsenosidimutans TaxID=1176537 RepID=A0ABP9C6G8_9SPHI
MGLFNFKKKPTEKGTDRSVTTAKEGYYGDLEKTAVLATLFEVDRAARDEAWNNEFSTNVSDASFACGEPQIIQGPDGFPYFQLQIPTPNKPFQCYVVRHIVSDFILNRGIGIVINAQKAQPDWVFTYGDLVNFAVRGEFYTTSSPVQLPKEEVIQRQEKVLMGQPSEAFLPGPARLIIRQFLEKQGIRDTKIALMTRQYGDDVLQELVTNLTPKKVGQERFEALQSHLKWFLPRHYAMVATDEDGSLKNNFNPL